MASSDASKTASATGIMFCVIFGEKDAPKELRLSSEFDSSLYNALYALQVGGKLVNGNDTVFIRQTSPNDACKAFMAYVFESLSANHRAYLTRFLANAYVSFNLTCSKEETVYFTLYNGHNQHALFVMTVEGIHVERICDYVCPDVLQSLLGPVRW
jgi:hypothetical protein